MSDILVIIPAYNESKSIVQTVKSITALDVDYIVINDGSTDNTSAVCKKNNIRFINLPFNLGIGGAVQTGYLYAFRNNYQFAIQFDGDGQHNADYIMSLVDELKNKSCDIVIGSRFLKREGFISTFSRRIGINILSFLLKILSGQQITDSTSGFRACNRKVIECFSNYYPKDYPEPESIMLLKRNGFVVKEIPVTMNERKNGSSSINFSNSIYYMIKVSLAIIIARIKPPMHNMEEK